MVRKKDSRSSKKINTGLNYDWRPWSELPSELLNLIQKQMTLIDHIAFGGVCRSWRESAMACKEDIIASQPPFVAILYSYATKTVSLSNIFQKRMYSTSIRSYAGRHCCGISCGYLIMQDMKAQNELWLVNPFTRHELLFPAPPHPIYRSVLASTATPSDSSILAISADFENLLLCRQGDITWTVHTRTAANPWLFVDVAVFKGQIYVLTNYDKIWKVNLNSDLCLTPVALPPLVLKRVDDLDPRGIRRHSRYLSSKMHLVSSNEHLLLVVDICHPIPDVFKVDFSTMQWVEMENLGDQALFLGEKNCAVLSNPAKWGGYGNCIYFLTYPWRVCTAVSLDGTKLGTSPVPGKPIGNGFRHSSPNWYFPQKSYMIDPLSETS